MKGGRLIERYVLTAVVPYLALSLLILTAVLITQQAARFAEVLGGAQAPLGVAAGVLAGLLPNVLVFTLPMATLVGTVTGFSRMGGDSELTAIRAAGVGAGRVLWPVLFLGAALSALTLYVAFEVAPPAARLLRESALRAALYKLESPVEPRSFYTGMPGKVIFVREGDQSEGQWGRVFIHWVEQGGGVRLVTARSGRIDVSGENSELVLGDAVVTTLPARTGRAGEEAQVSTERSAHLRVRDERLNAARNTLVRRLRERELELDELGWEGLNERIRAERDISAKRNAATVLHKKVALCLAPLVFALLGAALGLRVRRGGRGMGVLIALVVMIAFYLVSLAGEQAARAGGVPPALGAWLGVILCLSVGLTLLLAERWRLPAIIPRLSPAWPPRERKMESRAVPGRGGAVGGRLPISGLLNRYILRSLLWSFAGVSAALIAVFEVFTLFELLRFITLNAAGASLVPSYLFYLVPFIFVAVTPISTLLAVLITYALMARRGEAVAWWASGQSVYRMLWPGLLFACMVGAAHWAVQEGIMPRANQRQNELRARIRGGVSRAETGVGRQWLSTADSRRLYSYEFDAEGRQVGRLEVYEFDDEGVHLVRVTAGVPGVWKLPGVLEARDAWVLELGGGRPVVRRQGEYIFGAAAETLELFKPTLKTPAEMTTAGLSAYLKTLKARGGEVAARAHAVALERRRADPLASLAMALIGAPLAFAFGRRSALTAVCAAIVLGLAFWAVLGAFQQLGNYGLLAPLIAAWSPPVIFAAVGLYQLSRSRT